MATNLFFPLQARLYEVDGIILLGNKGVKGIFSIRTEFSECGNVMYGSKEVPNTLPEYVFLTVTTKLIDKRS